MRLITLRTLCHACMSIPARVLRGLSRSSCKCGYSYDFRPRPPLVRNAVVHDSGLPVLNGRCTQDGSGPRGSRAGAVLLPSDPRTVQRLPRLRPQLVGSLGHC